MRPILGCSALRRETVECEETLGVLGWGEGSRNGETVVPKDRGNKIGSDQLKPSNMV